MRGLIAAACQWIYRATTSDAGASIPDPGHGPTSGPAATEITVLDSGGGLPDHPLHGGFAWAYQLDGVAHATIVIDTPNEKHTITFPPGTSGNSLFIEDANRTVLWTSPVANPAFTET